MIYEHVHNIYTDILPLHITRSDIGHWVWVHWWSGGYVKETRESTLNI